MATFFNSKSKVWSGQSKPTIYNSDISVGQLVLEILKTMPNNITQVCADNDAEMTCAEMRKRIIKIAHYLITCGYQQHDIAGLIVANSENLTPLVFACMTLGMPINTLSPLMIESDIVHMFSKTKPKVIFCDASIIERVQNSIRIMSLDCEIITLREKIEGYKYLDDLLHIDLDISKFEYPQLTDVSSSTALILGSSGTTSAQKGVCKSHKQVIEHNINWYSMLSEDQHTILNFSTISGVSCCMLLFAAMFSGSKRVVTTAAYDSKLLVEIVNKYKVTILFLAPCQIGEFVNTNPLLDTMPQLKHFFSGGANVSKSLFEKFEPFVPNAKAFMAYACTECDSLGMTFESEKYKYGTVGKLYPNVQMKIINDSNSRCGPNETGEIHVKTLQPFLKYFDEPEKTREAFDDEGWMKMGDLGFFDEDGNLHITGRKKDMLRYNFLQVLPAELEEMIELIEGVACSSVVGVYDELSGNDIIFAFVQKTENSKVTEKEILDFVHERVIDAKKIRGGVHFLDSLPLTGSLGKVKKNDLKMLAEKIMRKSLINHF